MSRTQWGKVHADRRPPRPQARQTRHALPSSGGSEVGGQLQCHLDSVLALCLLGDMQPYATTRSRTPPVDAESRSHPLEPHPREASPMPVPTTTPSRPLHPRLRLPRAQTRRGMRWRPPRTTRPGPPSRPGHRTRRVHDHEMLELRGSLGNRRRPGNHRLPSRPSFRPGCLGSRPGDWGRIALVERDLVEWPLTSRCVLRLRLRESWPPYLRPSYLGPQGPFPSCGEASSTEFGGDG